MKLYSVMLLKVVKQYLTCILGSSSELIPIWAFYIDNYNKGYLFGIVIIKIMLLQLFAKTLFLVTNEKNNHGVLVSLSCRGTITV